MITVTTLPSSIERSRDGEWRVMRLPKFLMMLYPHLQTPTSNMAPPKARWMASVTDQARHSRVGTIYGIQMGTCAWSFFGSTPDSQI